MLTLLQSEDIEVGSLIFSSGYSKDEVNKYSGNDTVLDKFKSNYSSNNTNRKSKYNYKLLICQGLTKF